LKLERNLVLGRHRLDIRQPLASTATLSYIESRNWLGFKTGERTLSKGNTMEVSRSSSDGQGRSSSNASEQGMIIPNNQHLNDEEEEDDDDDDDEQEGEEHDKMLENCKHHEVIDITFMDPEFDRRKLQQLSSRLDLVRTKDCVFNSI
jgi:hypothetical protein